MKCIFYTIHEDPKTVDKSLSDGVTIEGVLRDPLNVVDPIIEFEAEGLVAAEYNYVYIEDLARYYFCTITNDSYTINTATCHCDVLKTACDLLKARRATLKRSEYLYNGYLNDPDFNAYAYRNIVLKSFPSGITADNIILMTVG